MHRLHYLLGLLGIASLAGCGGSDINQPSGPNLSGNGISIVLGAQTKGTAAFSPNPLTLSLATSGVVRWSNDDQGGGAYGSGGVTHNITADDGSFSSGNLAPGSTYEATFGVAGTYGYHCSIHPTMTGTVIVTP
ncbi:MAG TPA: plastocyanin/azurin family copper-binding protein [Gemmatimonadales bacterium]|jgi:plastocyanin